MQDFYYFCKYAVIVVFGCAIEFIGIPNIYTMPLIVPLLYNYLAVQFGIIHPLEAQKVVKYKDIRYLMIILTTILNAIVLYFSKVGAFRAFLIILCNALMLFFSKPKQEKIDDETQKYIAEYFEKKNDE